MAKALAIDPAAVFVALEADRAAGILPHSVTTSALRYQMSSTRPGYLEQHDRDGRVVLGQFHDGEFVPWSAEKG